MGIGDSLLIPNYYPLTPNPHPPRFAFVDKAEARLLASLDCSDENY
jgi:hypothetical protein